MDVEATFSLGVQGARFGLAVFCPPDVATNEALSACTKISLHVSSTTSSDTRNATMTVAVPTTDFVNATSATSTEFVLPSHTEVRLRVLTDRNIVEAFGAEGLASVSVLTFPAISDTAAFAFAEAGLVATNTTAYSMGCKWLAGS